jgi:hypothetical protein
MKKLMILIGGLLLAVCCLTSVDAQAASQNGYAISNWHRLNPDQSNPAPEHERLTCSQGATWYCAYFKQAEPRLNFHWDSSVGSFIGSDATDSWNCPSWFPARVCRHVTRVASGRMAFILADGSTFQTTQEFVVTNTKGHQTLYVYWVDYGFACPWYRTFKAAVDANPFPLPFNGTNWPVADCFATA